MKVQKKLIWQVFLKCILIQPAMGDFQHILGGLLTIWLGWQFLGRKWFQRRVTPIDVESREPKMNLCGLSIVD